MVANLPPQFYQKEAELKKAKTLQEKIAILEEMLAIMPKHKSSEKLQAEIKAKISRYRKEMEKPAVAGRKSGPLVEREGAAQMVICGPANTGKSTLLAALTRATPVIADYPYTTKLPLPGMLAYQDIAFQLVDTPALSQTGSEPWLGELLRRADGWLFLFDLASDALLESLEDSLAALEKFHLKQPGLFSFSKPIIWVGNKIDQPEAITNKQVFQELYGDKIGDWWPISAKEKEGLSVLPEKIFQLLSLLRIYTKIPGKPPDLKAPFVLRQPATVVDLASAIHQELPSNFRYARLWRRDTPTPLVVGREFLLQDGDIVEIHT
ncbi:MAG: 50S ribosome-binding GTPase [Candidatus Omnitrophica bacterium]|nr:50S ribosome-binding GTPase [Candidatus Omnitrophota bacterium]